MYPLSHIALAQLQEDRHRDLATARRRVDAREATRVASRPALRTISWPLRTRRSRSAAAVGG